MALWKEASQPEKEPIPASPNPTPTLESQPIGGGASPQEAPVRVQARQPEESVIASDITIEGKIEGSGHVRLVGAGKVTIGGELEGNVDAASTVELLKTGIVTGDLKAGSVTIAAGSRMRGQADFGWDDKELRTSRMKVESGSRP